jgi:mannose-6-phosphate isomerase-like protein (cupin superfamily)
MSRRNSLATEPATSRAWWFLDSLAVLRNPEGAPRTPAMIEMTIPPGGTSPLHVHAELDDSFFVLDGELVFRCGEEMLVARAGSCVSLPYGVAYTFRVTSVVPARLVLVHAVDSFLSLVEAAGTPTTEPRLPREGEFDADPDTLMRLFEEHGVSIVGPPLDEDEARAFAAGASGASV